MTEPASPAVRGRSFDAWAVEYDRYRPSYPPALFGLIDERLGLPTPPLVVDLGSGTGKAALAMANRGWQVTAVEPGEPMLAVLRDRAATEGLQVSTVRATAEATTLPAGSFDLAVAAEAYHWFDAPRALAEIARILKRGGGLAFFWNVREVDSSPLLAAYEELAGIVGADRAELRRPGPREETRQEILATGLFERPLFEQVRHSVQMTGEELVGLAFTTSHVRTAAASVRGRFQRELDELLQRQGISPSTPITVPYVIDCWIAIRSAAGRSSS